MKESYLLIVSNTFDREPIEFEKHPTNEQIEAAIIEHDGTYARVDKIYTINKD